MPRSHQPVGDWNIPRLEWLEDKVQTARWNTQEAMKWAQSLWIKDKPFKAYQKGQKVWLEGKNLKTTHPTNKLCPLRYRPFKITEVLSLAMYQLQLPEQWKVHNVFHARLLHPYKETEAHGPNFTEPPPDLIEGQEEWEVEQVLASRQYGQKKALQYLLKWKGFSDAHNSWQDKGSVHAP
jgi:hypothetical protein